MATKDEDGPIETPCECSNCDWQGDELDLVNQFPDIPDLTQRIAPGEVVPAGECPECGALCHIVTKSRTETVAS